MLLEPDEQAVGRARLALARRDLPHEKDAVFTMLSPCPMEPWGSLCCRANIGIFIYYLRRRTQNETVVLKFDLIL